MLGRDPRRGSPGEVRERFRGTVPDDMQNKDDKNTVIINHFAVAN
jgi:hypothetical protein